MSNLSAGAHLFYFFGRIIARTFYRVTALGQESLPNDGFLLLPNHISFVDAIVLQLVCSQRIRYIIDEEFYRKKLLRPIMRWTGCIPITSRHAKDAVRAAADAIRAGEVVCLFPEGQLTRSGALGRLQRGYELIARHADAKVVPVWLDQLWEIGRASCRERV